MRDEGLTEKLAAAAVIFHDTGILAAYAYGSRITGNPRPDSDLDVGYFLRSYRRGGPLSVRSEMRLADVLSQSAGIEVDLRDLGEAPLELRGRAIEEGVRIFSADDDARVALERDLLGRYHDYKDEFRRMHELRLRRLAEGGARSW